MLQMVGVVSSLISQSSILSISTRIRFFPSKMPVISFSVCLFEAKYTLIVSISSSDTSGFWKNL